MQDDLRLRPNLTFSPGPALRAADARARPAPASVRDSGLTWAPGKNGRTTIRTSYGIFYNWLGSNVYEQTLRVNGVRQQEINIVNPSYPDIGGAATVSATNKYVLGDMTDGAHPSLQRRDRSQRSRQRCARSVSFSLGRYGHQLRGVNLNAPVERRASRSGVRERDRGGARRIDGHLRPGA